MTNKRVRNATDRLVVAAVLAVIALSVRGQEATQIEGGYELQIKQYKEARRKVDEAMREEPEPVPSPVTPEEIDELKTRQVELGQQMKENPDDEAARTQFEATVEAKYAKLRKALGAEVANAANNISHDKRVVPLLEDFVRRGEEFKRKSEDRQLSPEQREHYRTLYKSHMGTYARYQKRIQERRNQQAQRLKLALVNARGSFDKLLLPDDELLKVIGEHTDYADALRTEYINDLKGWLGIAEQLQILIDNLEIRELVEGLTGQGMSGVGSVNRKLAERRKTAMTNIRKLYTMVAGPIGSKPDDLDNYGEEQIDEMSRW